MSAVNPPRLWKGYVDDTFVILQQSQKDFQQNINSVEPSINFTTEETRQDGSMPFLDMLVTPQEDGTQKTSVYKKPTHTDLYPQWDSLYNMACKYSVINTLTHRAKAVCSNLKAARERTETSSKGPLPSVNTQSGLIDRVLQKQEEKRTENRRN